MTVAQAATAGAEMSWGSLPLVIISGVTAIGGNKALELWLTRRSRNGQDSKVQVDAGVLISGELRQWAAQAIAEKDAANKRATEVETRFQLRVDDLIAKLDATGEKLDEAERRIDRLTARVAACQAGPVCPVRTADTNPRIPAVTPKQV